MEWESVFTRIANGAREKKELTDDEYRELILVEDISERLERLVDVLREKKLVQLVKGAEFIESITPEDPRYERALEKYDKISESILYEREIVSRSPSMFDIYNAMCECYTKNKRVMKYEELIKKFPNHTTGQVRWGMKEFQHQITPLLG